MMRKTYLSEDEYNAFSRLGWGVDDWDSQNSFENLFPMEHVPQQRNPSAHQPRAGRQDETEEYYDSDATMVDPNADVGDIVPAGNPYAAAAGAPRMP